MPDIYKTMPDQLATFLLLYDMPPRSNIDTIVAS